jgi:hypothetical protein
MGHQALRETPPLLYFNVVSHERRLCLKDGQSDQKETNEHRINVPGYP